MKNLYELSSEFRSMVRSHFFSFESDSETINRSINLFIEHNMLTESGKRRYPKYFQTVLSVLATELKNEYMNTCTIFCYEIDGQLFTTYNKKQINKYLFNGETEIPNYREAGKEDRLIELRKTDQKVKSGFFYGSGEPYFLSEN